MNEPLSDTNSRLTGPGINRADRFAVNLSWLIKLRWVAIVGQLLTILVVTLLLDIRVRVAPLAVILMVTAGSNLILMWWFRGWRTSPLRFGPVNESLHEDWPGSAVPGLVMTLDMLSLTTLLYSTGGLNNPFTFFFFVNLSLAALVVGRSWAWALNVLTIACFTFLIFDHIPIEELERAFPAPRSAPGSAPGSEAGHGFSDTSSAAGTRLFSLPQQGALVAFATCSSVIVYFMTRLTEELRIQQRDLRLAEAKQAQSEKLEALGTLAAGAAHELATPLSTIAIVAREVEQQIDSGGSRDETLEDVRLIRGELDRCRKILDQMSADAGHATGESLKQVTVQALIEEVLAGLPLITGMPNEISVRTTIDPVAGSRIMLVPVNILAQSIRGLVKNGVDATMQVGASDLEVDNGGLDDFGDSDKVGDPDRIGVQDKQVGHSETFQPLLIDVCENQPAEDVQVQSVAGDQKTVKITIQDFGIGMTDEVQRRMSDPFFTTKPVGRGMGLGVFLAISVIRRLDGTIHFDSEVGKGTTVEVILPAQD